MKISFNPHRVPLYPPKNLTSAGFEISAISDTHTLKNDIVSFSSTARTGSAHMNYNYSTYTKFFREDLDWLKFAKFLGENFKNKDRVNVINHACSDGSEPYTLAISLLETLPQKEAAKFFPIEARDIDSPNLQAANSGFINFTEDDLNAFKIRNIDVDKYFVKTDKKLLIMDYNHANSKDDLLNTQTYEVKPELRKLVNFKFGNIISDSKNITDDSDTVLLCRHVLPYIGHDDGAEVLEETVKHLKKGSVISLGTIYRSREFNLFKILNKNGFEPYNIELDACFSKTYVKM